MLLLLAFIATASAHDHWIEPVVTPSGVAVHVRLGEHLDEVETFLVKEVGRYTRFALHSSVGVRDLSASLRIGVDPIANIALSPAETGSLLIAMDSRTRDIEIDPAKFDAYLAEEGLAAVRAARGASAAPGKERYSRNLKAIFASGRPGGAIATAVVGQELEIVPAVDPLTLPEGGTLPLIIHFRGQPLADAQVMVANRVPTGTIRTWIQRTDSAGRVSFVVSGPGEWIARLVHMLPSTEPDVDWRSWWASLTFER